MSFLTWISGGSKLEAEGKDLDAKLAALNAKDYGPGGKLYEESRWDTVQKNLISGQTVNVDKEIAAGFQEGLDDGARNITGFVGGTFDFAGKGLWAIVRAIPWWVWIGVAIYLLATTGLLTPLLAAVGRKATGK